MGSGVWAQLYSVFCFKISLSFNQVVGWLQSHLKPKWGRMCFQDHLTDGIILLLVHCQNEGLSFFLSAEDCLQFQPCGLLHRVQFSSVSVVSDSLRPHELQHARPSCPSPTPGVDSDSRPSSQWCHQAISSSVVPFSSCPQTLPIRVFSNESTLCIRWPKYWRFSFNISPSNEHPTDLL